MLEKRGHVVILLWYSEWHLSSFFLPLPNGAVGWSVVCDCGISWSYSFTIKYRKILL